MRALALTMILNGFLMCGCSTLPPDNLVEEALEEAIYDTTGLDIDLSADDESYD